MATGAADIQGDELPPGSVLCGGQYTIDQYLNAGGFGVTYLARDSLGRRVVIKECFPSALCFRANKTVRVRSQGNAVEFDTILDLFEREARALAALQHPYIVGVHQYFRDNDTAYMAMDFVEGRTLLDLIENDPGRLTPPMVKNLLVQLLQAVDFIHRHDILHRDISPDNILIDENNLPVLIDFGAAREDATRVSRVLSKVLAVKDGYSPQEFYLANSDQVYASDLYALAATFHHVVTGSAPANSQSRMAAEIRNAADPLKRLEQLPGYDDSFLGAINTCLNLFPQDRLRTAEAWQEAIDADLRRKKLTHLAEMDRNIDRTIARLVTDFFKDFEPMKPLQRAAPEHRADTQSSGPMGRQKRLGGHTAPAGGTRIAEDTSKPAALSWGQDASLPVPAGARFCGLDEPPLGSATPDAVFRSAVPPKPFLQPIDRIRLKYMKRPDPEPEIKEPTLSSWLGRLGGMPRNDRRSIRPTKGKEEPT